MVYFSKFINREAESILQILHNYVVFRMYSSSYVKDENIRETREHKTLWPD